MCSTHCADLEQHQVHPLCPIPLFVCVENLTALGENGGVFDEQLKVIFNALNSLKRINILGQHSRSASTEELSPLTPASLDPTSKEK